MHLCATAAQSGHLQPDALLLVKKREPATTVNALHYHMLLQD
jgi:hypothetical protein